MPRVLVDDADGQPVFRISSCKEVLHEEFFALQIFEYAVIQRVKFFRRKLMIESAPGDGTLGAGVANGEFIFRSASGKRSGLADQGAVRSQLGLTASDRVLYQFGWEKIAVHILLLRQKLIEVERFTDRLGDHTSALLLCSRNLYFNKRSSFCPYIKHLA